MSDEFYRDILGFIGRFTTTYDGCGEREQVRECFLLGCCYWFAYILSARFSYFDPEIVFDDAKAHFACKIDGRVYDITGDVTEGYDWIPWDLYDDEAHKRRIEEQCIMF